MPDTSIDSARIRQYENTAILLAQQSISRLRNKCRLTDKIPTGKLHSWDRLGAMALVENSDRYADTQYNDAAWTRRSVGPRRFNGAELVDTAEKLQMGFEPMGPLSETLRKAAGRTIDDIIISAFSSTVLTGEDAGSTDTFPAANIVAVDYHTLNHETAGAYTTGDVPMTVGKFIAAKSIIAAGEADGYDEGGKPQVFALMSQQQIAAMYRQTAFTSSDYSRSLAAVANFETNMFLGVEIIRSQRNLLSGSNERVLMWHKNGLGLAFWEDIKVKIEQLPQKNYAWQVWCELMANAARIEDERCVQVLCTVPSLIA
jgi:hypothetical protein